MAPSMDAPAARRLLRAMFDAAVASALPARGVAAHLPTPAQLGRGRLVVVGAGKGAAAMARAVEDHWTGPPEALSGLVVTRYGHAEPCARIEVVEAAHPVPDAAGEAAARRLLAMVQGLSADDLVLCLISGGGSALLPLPLPGLTLADKQALNRALLASGADIGEMNCVRRHLSAIKGGRLAAACAPARVLNLLISDVPGDEPGVIASGPTVADPSTCADALAILKRYAIDVPPRVLEILQTGEGETLKPGDARLPPIDTRLIATPQQSLEAAAQVARQAGLAVHILGDAIEGEARDIGKVMAGLARQVARRGQPFTRPCVLLSGGEGTVTLKAGAGAGVGAGAGAGAGAGVGAGAEAAAPGRGGRNVEFLLSLAVALNGEAGVYGLAGDTDGIDGAEEIAGALMAPDTLARAWAAGINAATALARHDGHGFFQALGDSVVTGPTRTNVNDFRAVLIV